MMIIIIFFNETRLQNTIIIIIKIQMDWLTSWLVIRLFLINIVRNGVVEQE